MKGNNLMIDRSDEHGPYQRDMILLDALDTGALHFSSGADALVFTCSSTNRACCTSERYREAALRTASKLLVPLPVDDPSGSTTRTCIQSIAQAIHERLAETHTRP
jgi:hypothetical protein